MAGLLSAGGSAGGSRRRESEPQLVWPLSASGRARPAGCGPDAGGPGKASHLSLPQVAPIFRANSSVRMQGFRAAARAQVQRGEALAGGSPPLRRAQPGHKATRPARAHCQPPLSSSQPPALWPLLSLRPPLPHRPQKGPGLGPWVSSYSSAASDTCPVSPPASSLALQVHFAQRRPSPTKPGDAEGANPPPSPTRSSRLCST